MVIKRPKETALKPWIIAERSYVLVCSSEKGHGMCPEIMPLLQSSFDRSSLSGFLVGLWLFVILHYHIKNPTPCVMTHRTSFSAVSKFMLITYLQVLFRNKLFKWTRDLISFQTSHVSSLLTKYEKKINISKKKPLSGHYTWGVGERRNIYLHVCGVLNIVSISLCS